MKSFESICKMTQPEIKKYMSKYLVSNNYEVVNKDGFLYAKGDVPVLLVAHMDTVHKELCKTIINDGGKMSSPQGIGGDDRCGVFIIMNLIKNLHCSVLLCEDEEKGCVGAHKFVEAKQQIKNEDGTIIETRYIDGLGVNYMIEFDRRGNNDAVFYHCGNKEFINFVEDATNFKKAYGSVSDISVLMPEAKLSAVNLSCGYYNPHTTEEYVMYDEMMDTVEAAKALIKEKCDKPFEYIRKTYTPTFASGYGGFDSQYTSPYTGRYYDNFLDAPQDNYRDEPLANVAISDKELELEAIIYDTYLGENTLRTNGETKAECWMNLFLENPNLRFNDIIDYSWG